MGDRTVHVGNLETFVNESTLYLLFSQFGTVTNVRLAGDPKMQTRYAFVEFNDSVMAHAACLLDGLQVGSRNLRVSLSKPYAGKGAASAAVQNPLAALMGGGLAATPAVSAPRKRSTVEDQERISRTIHVRNVDIQITEAMLVEYFGVCGTVTAARTAGTGNPRTAWIEFAAQQSALAALSLDGQVLAGQTLRISPSKSAIQTNALSQRNAPPAALPTMTPAMMMAAVAAPQNIVKVQGIPAKASEADVRALMEGRCGHVRSLIIVPVPGPPPEEPGKETDKEKGEKGEEGGEGEEGYKGPTKMATVEVEDAGAVAKALELNGTKFMGATISYVLPCCHPPSGLACLPLLLLWLLKHSYFHFSTTPLLPYSLSPLLPFHPLLPSRPVFPCPSCCPHLVEKVEPLPPAPVPAPSSTLPAAFAIPGLDPSLLDPSLLSDPTFLAAATAAAGALPTTALPPPPPLPPNTQPTIVSNEAGTDGTGTGTGTATGTNATAAAAASADDDRKDSHGSHKRSADDKEGGEKRARHD
ncbi:unnamed protein product [Closterium sp. Yama58-4]|nr:unnamed protein product [Closterium sp. Yama58-4]